MEGKINLSKNSIKKKISLFTSIILIISMLTPVIVSAAGYARFYYDPNTGDLFGWVYAQDPDQVSLEVKYSGSSDIHSTYDFACCTLYDDDNNPYQSVVYQVYAAEQPSLIQIHDSYDSSVLDVVYEDYINGEAFYRSINGIGILSSYRMNANQYFSNYSPNSYLKAGMKLYSFIPTQSNSDALELTLPWNLQNETSFDPVNTTSSDFVFIDESTGQQLNITYFSFYNNFIATFEVDTKFISGHTYTLLMSPTSEGNEILVPPTGIYWAQIILDNLNSLNQITYEGDNSIYFDDFNIGSTSNNQSSTSSSSSTSHSKDTHILDENDYTVEELSTENCDSLNKISLFKHKLAGALETVAKDDRLNEVEIHLSQLEGCIDVNIPAGIIKETKQPNTQLFFKGKDADYKLPINSIELEELAKQFNVDIEDLELNIKIDILSQGTTEQMKQKAENQGINLLSDGIDFKVIAKANGKEKEIKNFNGAYLERTIHIPQQINKSNTTGVLYNPDSGQFIFVPSTIEDTDTGSIVVIKRPGNSIYAVAQFNKKFNDTVNHWAKEDIELLGSKLLVQGITDSQFAPDQEITRAQFITILVRALGLNPKPSVSMFNDVDEADWYAGAVGAAVDAGLVQGTGDGWLAPNQSLTRAEMAVMMEKALRVAGTNVTLSDPNILNQYKDYQLFPDWSKDAIAATVEKGLLNGMSESIFAPNEKASRAQAVVALTRFLKYVDFID